MGEEQPGMLNGKEKSKNIKTKKNRRIYPIGCHCGP